MSDNPPFTITPRMLDLVFRIGERVSRIEGYDVLDPSPRLRKQNMIRSVYSSCSIEANSLSLGQVADVINGRNVVGPEKDIREVKNAYKAYSELGSFDPYSKKDFLRMHGVMAEGVAEDAGKFRTRGEGVFSGDVCIFVAPPPELVPQHIEDLFKWLNSSSENIHPLIASCVFHYEMVFIHPFTDGNGRMARLWQTAILGRWRPVFYRIPVENRIEMTQREYYEAIDRSNRAGDSTAFTEFMLQTILNAVEDAESEIKNNNQEIPSSVSRLADVMEDGKWYTFTELKSLVGLKARSTFIANYLNPAMARGLVEMEFPDSPRSRGQRYRLRQF